MGWRALTCWGGANRKINRVKRLSPAIVLAAAIAIVIGVLSRDSETSTPESWTPVEPS